MKKKRWFGIPLSLMVVFSVLFQGFGTTVFAEEAAKVVDTVITDFRIEKPKGTEATEINKNDSFYIAMDWKVQDENAVLKEGDYFDIQLPDNMRFPPSFSQSDFDLTDANGEVIARAHVTPGANDSAGGTIRVTFNDKINNKYNVKGTIYLGALFNKQKTKDNEINTFEVSVNGKTTSTELKVTKIGLPSDHVLSKWGERVTEGGQTVNRVKWYATINYRKSDLKNCVISDEISGEETYITDSFKLSEVEYNDEGGTVKTISVVDIAGKLTFGSGNKSFALNLGDAGTKQYRLSYETTYTPKTELTNKLKLVFDGESKEYTSTFKDSNAGGTAGGNLASKIKLTKVDAEDNSVVLANAVFEVTGPDGNKFELTTGTDGTVTSGILKQGTYKVKEKTAPKGYLLNEEEYTLEVTPDGGALKTIKDEPKKITVAVEKKWIGPAGNSVVIHLYADGKDTGKTVTLNALSNWKGTFDNLRQYNTTGEEIQYSIKEDAIEHYKSEITGDVATGFTVKNVNTEKREVSVTKRWVGKAKDSVTIKLLADNAEKETVTLTAADDWKHVFKNLPKYDETDGHEIVYTLEEVKIDGYNIGMTGTADTGFTITNTITGKVSVPVTKTWIGKERDSVKIRLYAGETEMDSVVLTKANGWQHTFTNLEKYKDGEEIKYSIKEDVIENYKSEITGDATSGYVVKNTNTEKLSVPVTKQWIGKATDAVEVKLLADGQEKESAVLTAEDSWQHTFKNLPKYDETDGHEIVYTVDEVKVDGYTTGISGTAEEGFTITNTITGRVSVPVTKKWVGDAADNITVHLYADGRKVDTQKLSKENHWQYTFKDLDQYKDGKEIIYTVEEERISGYTMTMAGDAKSGFVITNTKDVPKKPNKSTHTPKTGDSSNFLLYGSIAVASLGAVLFLFGRRKKQR